MSVTRGEFMKQFAKSLPGMVLGSGIAGAAQRVLGKVAAVSHAMEGPNPSPAEIKAPVVEAKEIPFIEQGPENTNQIALTFDDGPTPGVTDLLLDVLKEHNAKATFFMIGQNIAKAPALARRVLDEGHEIANHTYTHPHLDQLSDTKVGAELDQTQEVIAKELHYSPRWFRPPYGGLRQNQTHLVASRGLGIITWSVNPADWSKPGAEVITGRVLEASKPGAIIVCHDFDLQTVEATKIIVPALLQRGLVFSTVSQLLR